MFGSLINKGVEGIASSLGANDKVAGLIGSGVATATGLIPGMQGNLTEGADLIGDIGTAAGDKSGITQGLSQIGGIIAPFIGGIGGSDEALAKLAANGAPQALANGGYMKPYSAGGSLTEFQNGGTHEQNPNGGIPVGQNALVEEGETMDKDFVFSDRLKINKVLAREFNLPTKYIGKSFAEVSKAFEDSSRPNDVITKRGFDKEVANLKQAQEAFKEVEGIDRPKGNQMALGGPTGLLNNEDPLNAPGGLTTPTNAYQGFNNSQTNVTVEPVNQNTNTPNNTPTNQTPVQPNGANLLSKGVQPQQTGPSLPYGADLLAGNPNEQLGKSDNPTGPSMANGNFLSGTSNQNSKTDYSSLARFAPVASEAINLGRTLANKPTAKNTSMFNTNQTFDPNLLDAEQTNRDIESQGNANRNMIRNNSGGNQGNLMSNLIGSQLQTDKAIGQSNIQVDSVNNQELGRVEGLNYNQTQTNAGKQMQVQDWNDRDMAAFNNSVSQGISTMGQNIGNVGTDSMNRQMAKDMPMDYFMNLLGKTKYKGGQ